MTYFQTYFHQKPHFFNMSVLEILLPLCEYEKMTNCLCPLTQIISVCLSNPTEHFERLLKDLHIKPPLPVNHFPFSSQINLCFHLYMLSLSLFGFSNCLISAGSVQAARRSCLHGGPQHPIPSRAAGVSRLKCSCCLAASRYTFLIEPPSFDLTTLKPKIATSVSLLIMFGPISSPGGGIFAYDFSCGSGHFQQQHQHPRKKRATPFRITQLFIVRILTIFLSQRLISILRLRVGALDVYSA